MNIDYGSRIRAVADYLETVPGEKYDFYIGPGRAMGRTDGCGCAMTHGLLGGIITAEHHWYRDAIEWTFGFDTPDRFHDSLKAGACMSGEDSKRIMVESLRAYADKHYPVNSTPKHTGIPACVREIFEGEAA